MKIKLKTEFFYSNLFHNNILESLSINFLKRKRFYV